MNLVHFPPIVDFRLEEASQDLQQTKVKLSQEEFICSELASVQETLYDTAGQVRTSITDADTQRFHVHDWNLCS